MRKIKLLDCTLRDGGYINDWDFGIEMIGKTINNLEESNIDILELGFLKDESYRRNRTVFNKMSQINALIKNKKPYLQYAAMIEVVNPLPLDKLDNCSDETVDIIRVIVWKRLINEGFEYCKGVVEKGYKLCVQPARVDQYSYEEFEEMVKKFSTLNPLAIYVVDSFGTQDEKTLEPYFKIAHNNMPSNIWLGYHGHNNLMQAMEVSKYFINMDLDRNIILDASIYGMGRGAGNLNSELIAKDLNDTENKDYRPEKMLEIYDRYLKSIYNWCPWGYSLPYYLTAKYNCNPNYASYYDWELKLPTDDIKGILEMLSDEDKIMYTKEKADEYLSKYRKKK